MYVCVGGGGGGGGVRPSNRLLLVFCVEGNGMRTLVIIKGEMSIQLPVKVKDIDVKVKVNVSPAVLLVMRACFLHHWVLSCH